MIQELSITCNLCHPRKYAHPIWLYDQKHNRLFSNKKGWEEVPELLVLAAEELRVNRRQRKG
jgi:hypothetical protein